MTSYPGAPSNLLGWLARVVFVFGSTISLCFAGFRDGGVRGSRGDFAGPVQRIGFIASHGSVTAHNPYLSGYRGAAMGYPEYRGPLVAPNRETAGSSRNGFVRNPASQIGTIRRQAMVPQTRDLNPPAAVRPFGAPAQGPQRDSAEINAQRSGFRSQHLSANPAVSEARARINGKLQQYQNKFGSDPRISDDRRARLNRVGVFLLNLIDLGYAPLIVDGWFDDLLNDQIGNAHGLG